MVHLDGEKPLPLLDASSHFPPSYRYPYVPSISHYPPPNQVVYQDHGLFHGVNKPLDFNDQPIHVDQSRMNFLSNDGYPISHDKPSDEDRSEPSRPTTADGKERDVKVEVEDEEKIDHRKRKRNRTIRSCVPCHNHKRKVGSQQS